MHTSVQANQPKNSGHEFSNESQIYTLAIKFLIKVPIYYLGKTPNH